MIKQVQTIHAPAAVGPYSQAVTANGLAFLSGMLPLDIDTGEMIGTSASDQTKQIIDNISGLLSELNLTLTDVIKTTVFLKSMDSFQSVNEVYGSYFSKPDLSWF